MGLNGTRTIEISSEDYEVVKSLAKSSEGLKTQNKHLLGRVEQVESHLVTLRDQNSLLAEQKRRLMDENKQLKKTIKAYEQVIDYLKRTLEAMKHNSIKGLDIAKEKMQAYVGHIRIGVLEQTFGPDVLKKEQFDQYIPDDERPGAEKRRDKLEHKREQEKVMKNQKKQELDLER